jgi:hypothetical protein
MKYFFSSRLVTANEQQHGTKEWTHGLKPFRNSLNPSSPPHLQLLQHSSGTRDLLPRQLQQHSTADSTPPFSANMSGQPSTIGGPEGLRERFVTQTIYEEGPSSGSSGLVTPQDGDDVEKERKTFGRTPSGTSMFARWWG